MENPKRDASKNRRQAVRKTPRGTVSVECRRGCYGFGKNLVTQFLDLSEGGVRLIVSEELELKGEVEVQMLGFGQKKAIKRTAHVCWAYMLEDGTCCVGLEFEKRLRYPDVLQLARP